MFKRNTTPTETQQPVQAVERITSVLGSGVIWHGSINGSGGVRIEGAFEGEIALRGMLVVGLRQEVHPPRNDILHPWVCPESDHASRFFLSALKS